MIVSLIGAITFGAVSVLYILIALGYPLGEFAMGGKFKTVPSSMRFMYVISIIIQWFGIMILLQTAGMMPLIFSYAITRGICIFFAVYLTLNVVMNLISRSKKERYLMTPLSIVIAICYWMTVFGS